MKKVRRNRKSRKTPIKVVEWKGGQYITSIGFERAKELIAGAKWDDGIDIICSICKYGDTKGFVFEVTKYLPDTIYHLFVCRKCRSRMKMVGRKPKIIYTAFETKR